MQFRYHILDFNVSFYFSSQDFFVTNPLLQPLWLLSAVITLLVVIIMFQSPNKNFSKCGCVLTGWWSWRWARCPASRCPRPAAGRGSPMRTWWGFPACSWRWSRRRAASPPWVCCLLWRRLWSCPSRNICESGTKKQFRWLLLHFYSGFCFVGKAKSPILPLSICNWLQPTTGAATAAAELSLSHSLDPHYTAANAICQLIWERAALQSAPAQQRHQCFSVAFESEWLCRLRCWGLMGLMTLGQTANFWIPSWERDIKLGADESKIDAIGAEICTF